MPSENRDNKRLDSWKEIAAYLRRDERTAIRWEKEKKLPVHRVPGGRRKAVFAFTDELDAWLTCDETAFSSEESRGLSSEDIGDERSGSEPTLNPATSNIRDVFRIRFAGYVVSIAVIILIALWVASMKRSRSSVEPVGLAFTANAMEALDGQNRLLWTHTFSGILEPAQLGRQELMTEASRIGDFRGNGTNDVFVIAPVGDGMNDADHKLEADMFSGDGRLLWSYVPNKTFKFGKYDLQGSWAYGDSYASFVGRNAQLWAAFVHPIWGNSFVVSLDPATGRDTLRYVNTGTIRALSEVQTGQRTFLLVGGFNNEADTSSLAIVDENRSFATSPQTRGSRHECTSCPDGESDYYFEFPRSEINELMGLHEGSLTQIHVTTTQVEVVIGGAFREDPTRVHYLLQADGKFRPFAIRFNSNYDSVHRQYERLGKLRHSLEQCPERLHPRPVKVWTLGSGWKEVAIPPTPFNQ